MHIVIAIDGNALLERGQKPDAAVQEENSFRAVEALAPLARPARGGRHARQRPAGRHARAGKRDPDLTRPIRSTNRPRGGWRPNATGTSNWTATAGAV
jgi:carbamate kinase